MIMASKLRKFFLLIGIIVMGSFVANALGIHLMPPVTTVHGKPTVKLSKKLSLDLQNTTTGVAWSPDGLTLGVSSFYGPELNTFDSSGHPLNELQSNGSKGPIFNAFAFINGSSQVLFPVENAAKGDAALDVRDVATGRIVNTLTANYITHSFAVSPDQKRVAIASDVVKKTNVNIYDTKDWHELLTANELAVGKKQWIRNISLSFFPDSKLLAVGQTEGNFVVMDSTTGKTIKEFHAYDPPVEGTHDNIGTIAVSPKGDLILTGLNGGGTSGEALRSDKTVGWLKNEIPINIWRVSDGKQVASLANRQTAALTDPGKLIRQAVWDPKGRFVAFIDANSLVVWQPEIPGENFIRIKSPHLTDSLAITSDGKSLAVAAGNNVTVYNIEDNFQKSS
jgi:WD40 repeat protein